LCGGAAQYFGWDATLVRLVVVIGAFVTGGAVAMAYLIGWVIVPADPTRTAFFDRPGNDPRTPPA
jgi:phage shock protein C